MTVDPNQLNQLLEGMSAYRSRLLQLGNTVADPNLADHFASLARELDKGRDYLATGYAQELRGAEQRVQQSLAKIKSVQQEIEAHRQQLEAQHAAAAQRVPPAQETAPEPIDPTLGAKLRKELLERFGTANPAQGEPQRIAEIWEGWDAWQTEPSGFAS